MVYLILYLITGVFFGVTWHIMTPTPDYYRSFPDSGRLDAGFRLFLGTIGWLVVGLAMLIDYARKRVQNED